MRALLTVTMAAMLVLGTAAAAVADWDPDDSTLPQHSTNHKMHFPQMPDLSDFGLDVLAGPIAYQAGGTQVMYEKFLADDFLCTQTGPITDIHIWASYNEDIQLMPATGLVPPRFSLVIYENVPPDALIQHSRPGKPVWNAYLRPTRQRVYAKDIYEQFYDPNADTGYPIPPFNGIIGQDTVCWQYNFIIPDTMEPFVQKDGETYWLGVHHTLDLDGSGTVDLLDMMHLAEVSPGAFGWKTAVDPEQWHYEDDAVWTDVDTMGTNGHVVPSDPIGGPADGTIWRELIYPAGHEYEGLSMDLAFVITPEPATMTLLGLGAVCALLKRRRR